MTGLFASKATKRAAAQNYDFVPGNKIVQNPRGNSAEVRKGSHVAFEERLSGLGRKCHHEAIVRVWQVHRQVMRLLLHACHYHQRFAEVCLRLARRVRQGNNISRMCNSADRT